jgi:predicted Na+-dependent transporter
MARRWVVLAAVIGYHYPSLFLWFNNTYVTWSLVFCMAAMGLTLTFDEIMSVFTRSPQLLLLGETHNRQQWQGRPALSEWGRGM